jgi:hypothetical protein
LHDPGSRFARPRKDDADGIDDRGGRSRARARQRLGAHDKLCESGKRRLRAGALNPRPLARLTREARSRCRCFRRTHRRHEPLLIKT